MTGIPPYLFISDVQKLLKWHKKGDSVYNKAQYRATERWLRRKGLIVERCGRQVVTSELLRTHLPELWSQMADDAFELVAMERRR